MSGKGWMSQDWKSRCVGVRVSHEGVQCNPQSCRVSRTAQSFFSLARRCDFLIRLGCSGFGRSQLILDSLWQHVSSATEEAKLFVKTSVDIPVELAFCLSQVWRKDQEWWLLLFRVEPLPWVEQNCCSSAWNWRTLPDLVVNLLESDLVRLFQKIWKLRFNGRVLLFVPVSAFNSLNEFSESCKGGQLVMVDHIILMHFASPL